MLLSHSVYNYTWRHCEFTVFLSHSVYKCTWRRCEFTVLLSHSVYVHHDHVYLQCCCLTLSTSWPYYVFPVLLSHSVYLHQDNTIHVCFQCGCLTLSIYIMAKWVSNVAILHHFWQRSRPLSLTRTVEFKGCIRVQYSENWLLKMQVNPRVNSYLQYMALQQTCGHL